MLPFYALYVTLGNMVDSVAADSGNVSLLIAASGFLVLIPFACCVIGLLGYLTGRRRSARKGAIGRDRHYAQSGSQGALPVNTWAPSGYTRAGGSHLWPSALVGPAVNPAPPRGRTVPRGRASKQWLRQRRRLSGQSAATLIHQKGSTS